MTPYADRGLVTREQWNGIIRGATGELWLFGNNSPTFEFRAREAPKMFTRYTRHFEATWTNAEDWYR